MKTRKQHTGFAVGTCNCYWLP